MKKALLAGLTISLGLNLSSPIALSNELLYSKVMLYVQKGEIPARFIVGENVDFSGLNVVHKITYVLPNGIEVKTTHDIPYDRRKMEAGLITSDFMLLPNLYSFREGSRRELWEDYNQDGLNGNEERIPPERNIERNDWQFHYINSVPQE